MIAFINCILLFTYLLTWVSYSCQFHVILSTLDSSSLLFENDSDEQRKRKLISFKINVNFGKNSLVQKFINWFMSTPILNMKL